jgi:hypothetical protein
MKNVFGITAQAAGRIVLGQAHRLPGFCRSACRAVGRRGDRRRVRRSIRGLKIAPSYSFDWRSQNSRATVGYENLSENPVFNPGGRDLHSEFRGR